MKARVSSAPILPSPTYSNPRRPTLSRTRTRAGTYKGSSARCRQDTGQHRRAPLRVVDQEVPCRVALVAGLPPRLSALPLPDYGKIPTFCAGISQAAPSVASTLGIHDWKERTNGGDHTSVDRKGEPRRGREGLVRRVTLLSRGEALTGTISGTDKPHNGG
jgi:hypothetical protein